MGRDAWTAIMIALQNKQGAGKIKTQIYSPTHVMTKADVKPGSVARGRPRFASPDIRRKKLPVGDHVIGEILSKKWIDNAIPFLVLVCIILIFGSLIPNFYTGSNLSITARQLGGLALGCLAMTTGMT
eukprot:gene47799-62270_t